MKIIEWVKSHPWLAAGIAFVVVIIALLFFSGGSDDESTGAMSVALPTGAGDQSSVLAGLQIQALGIQAKQAETEINALKDIKLAEYSRDTTVAEYQKQTAFHVADITAQTAQRDIASRNYLGTLQYRLGQMAEMTDRRAVELGEITRRLLGDKAFKLGMARLQTEQAISTRELTTQLRLAQLRTNNT